MTSPWIDHLLADETGALNALLSGTASLGPLTAAEPEDAAEALLTGHPRGGEVWAAFDHACLLTLQDIRNKIFGYRAREFQTALHRLHDLLAILRRTQPAGAIRILHAEYENYLRFFDNFVLDRGFDLRREFYRLLAATQDEAALAELPPRRLMSAWLYLCGESGPNGRYDHSYLRIGLNGLRKLPLGKDFDANEDFVLHGLTRWALNQRPEKADFLQEWRVVEGDFPRSPDFWAKRIEAIIRSVEQDLREQRLDPASCFPAAQWWREEMDLEEPPRSVRPTASGTIYEPPPREHREDILHRIAEPCRELRPLIEDLMRRHQAYADSTGDVFYLVRTACNVGMRLLEKGPPQELVERGELAVSLARTALLYEPDNVYAWALWRDGLAAAGRLADAELVGWEAIRRYPENPQWKNQLAILLADDLGRMDEAGALLLTAKQDATADKVAQSLLDKLKRGHKLRKRGASAKPAAIAVKPGELILPTAEARRLLFWIETMRTDLPKVAADLSRLGEDAYASYVAERTGARRLPMPTCFAIAFEAALREAQPSALRAMIAQARPLEREIVQAAIDLGEGRIVALPSVADRNNAPPLERRWRQVHEQVARMVGQPELARLRLRDFAASFLSNAIPSLAA